MKAVVTGGAGFIGSHIVDALVARGDEVVVIDDLSRGQRSRVNDQAELLVCDITGSELRQHMARVRPDIVFHQAAQIDLRRSVREPEFDTAVNVVGTVNVLQSCHDAGASRVIFASSGGAIYGDSDALPFVESHLCAPSSPYGAAKQCGEVYGGVYSRLYGLDFVALRYANVYGPRQDPHGEAGVVAIFAEKLLARESALINGDGRQTRDYIHVADVVSANIAAIDGAPGAYNIGTGVEADVNEIYRLVAAACNISAEPQHGPAKPGEQRRSCLDVSLAKSALGWAPHWELSDGIADTVEFFRGARV